MKKAIGLLILLTTIIATFFSCRFEPLPAADPDESNYIMVMNNSGNPSSISAKINKLPKVNARTLIAQKAAEETDNYIKDLMIPIQEEAYSTSRSMQYIPAQKVNYQTEEAEFYVYSSAGTYYKITAEKKYGTATSKALVFVEKGAYPTKTTTYVSDTSYNTAGQIFEEEIDPAVTSFFGTPTDLDGNNQVIILYFAMSASAFFHYPESRVCGYFYKGDLYSNISNSNGGEIFYINLNAAHPLSDLQLRTIAHEYQHMISYGRRVIMNNLPEMDLWIDEGLSESAETIYSEEPNYSRISYMKYSSKIANGHPLVTFENDLEDYAMSYTFIQYLRLQARQSRTNPTIYSEIVQSKYGDYRAIESVMKKVDFATFPNFEEILIHYHIANKFNKEGVYGYREESDVYDFTAIQTTSPPEEIGPGACLWVPVTKQDLDGYNIPINLDPKLTVKKFPENSF
ncbi:MAG: hypothetical protein JXR63_09840 [Spirochaetales bacterium]|nr:hypothetical protein [Spirochaetales bacterium]